MDSDLHTRVSIFVQYVRLAPYDPSHWFRRCYASIQRTVHGGLPRNTRRELRSRLFDGVARLAALPVEQQAFEAWHSQLLDELQACSGLRLGQVQKLINLLLKYYYAYLHANIDSEWSERHQHIEALSPYFHVPIDVYVLVSLKQKYNYPRVALNSAATYATLRLEGQHTAWSRLTAREPYEHVQHFIRNLAVDRSAYASPLHFEMCELWTAPK